MKTVIGIDYGTLSARAILVDAQTGQVLHSRQISYPHGVMPGNLASAQDYDDVLLELLRTMGDTPWADSVAGICVDATSMTMVPLGRDGRPLAMNAGLAEEPHAQIKLWKYHGAQKQADEALVLAQAINEPFLRRTGGTISCEWMLPKLLQCRDEAPDVYRQIDAAMDLCEYLTYRLTNQLVRSVGSMSFKCLWSRDLGFPSDEYLNTLRPDFSEEYRRLLRGEVRCTGEVAGSLLANVAQQTGLRPGIPVAVGALDGHTVLVALGALHAGDAALVVGTSNVLTAQTAELHEIPGICGIAPDGLTPGLYGLDMGQACTGDMLSWYMEDMLPASVLRQAAKMNKNPHDYLCGLVREPWNNQVSIADWWNGSRNAPCDLALQGCVSGLSLSTKPQDVYLAMLQAIACGTRQIVELCAAHGVKINRLVASGGITQKNPLLMQQYADILHMPIHVGKITEGPALGSAILAAVAAGLYATPAEAWNAMGVKPDLCYLPDDAHAEAYESLYQRNSHLRQQFISR